MASSSDTLDTLIVKATNPLVEKPDPLFISSFCDKVSREVDGPQIAVKLLAYRIHSPQEKEALNALSLLEQCVANCGSAFHCEIGKFRFLNELIKLVSPKYLAHRTPIPVKQRIIDILFTWTIDLKNECKIQEAYDMLKKQGVIKDNPNYLGEMKVTAETPSPKQRAPFFDDPEKDALLQKLLQSKNPEDLQAANRLIKSMVREEENRIEAASRRKLEMQSVNTSIRLLEEFLENCELNGASVEDLELCAELASNCDKLRPNLSKLAAETDDKDDILGEILQTSDELSQALERYESFAKNPRRLPETSTQQLDNPALDLLSLDPIIQPHTSAFSALDDQLLFIGEPSNTRSSSVNLLQPQKLESIISVDSARGPESAKEGTNAIKLRGLEDLDILGEALLKQNLTPTPNVGANFQKVSDKIPLNELVKIKAQEVSLNTSQTAIPKLADASVAYNPLTSSIGMNFDLLVQSHSVAPIQSSQSFLAQDSEPSPLLSNPIDPLIPYPDQPSGQLMSVELISSSEGDVSMLDSITASVDITPAINDDVQLLHSPTAHRPQAQASAPSLAEIFVKFEEIKPSSKPPITLLSQESGVNVNLYNATAEVPKNVSLFVLSTTSKSSSLLTNFTFQAIVPKGNRVKLQPPSDNKLPPFNPFLPPPAITQVILLSTPGLNLIELKYVVSFDMDGETITEMGSIKELTLGNH